MSVTYTIQPLPADEAGLVAVLDRFVAFRLNAEETSTATVAQTAQHEPGLSRSRWMSRLLTPQCHALICLAHASANDDGRGLESEEWVGMLTLLGPLSRAEYEVPGSGGPELGSDDEEVRFHMTGMYFDPSHRCRQARIQLNQYVLDFVRSCAEDRLQPSSSGPTKVARVRGTISPGNHQMKAFAEGLAGRAAGMFTEAEMYRANGFPELVPAPEEASDMHSLRCYAAFEFMVEC